MTHAFRGMQDNPKVNEGPEERSNLYGPLRMMFLLKSKSGQNFEQIFKAAAE